MKNKGFSLVELMGIIIILSLISLLVIPTVDRSVKRFKEEAYNSQIRTIEAAAKDWVTDNLGLYEVDDGDTVQIILGQLKMQGYIEPDFSNPNTNTQFPDDMFINITRTNKTFRYEVLTQTGVNTTNHERAPIILLNGNYIERINLNSTYTEKGVSIRNYKNEPLTTHTRRIFKDGVEVPSLTTNIAGNYTIHYSVTDEGLTRTIFRQVKVLDLVKPVITLNGSNIFQIALGGTFTDPGATAFDYTDGNLTSSIIVTGTVNTNVEGTYTLTYNVTDSEGNKASPITRTIVVSSLSNNLVLDYRFTEFQEPTINLSTSINPFFSAWGTPIVTGSSQFFTAPDGSQGVYANIVYNGSGGVLWRSSNNNQRINVLPSTQYTMSAIIKWEGPGVPHANLFYFRQFRSDGTQISEGGQYTAANNIALGDGWFLTHRTVTTTAETVQVQLQSYQYSTIQLWMYNFQFEPKSYYTPFVLGTRLGQINDYSSNGRNITLEQANTPRWMTERNGSYLFNGTNSFMRLNNFNGTSGASGVTYSLWYRVNQEQGYLLWQNNAVLVDVGHASPAGQMRLRFSLDGDWRSTYTWNYNLNVWTHLVITWDGTNTRVYQNGIRIVNATFDGAYSSTTTANSSLDIGARDALFFRGSIDNIRIYNRAITEAEVSILYNSY